MAADACDICYSIVVPVFNEEAVLPVLLRRLDILMAELDGPAETIFVDDASTDCSSIILRDKAKTDPRYRYIGLSRNFGHQVAISAGMDAAAGQAVIIMDADLQDPPEVVGEMIARWRDGFDIVYGRRLSRDGESPFKRWTASLFYRVLGRLSSIDIPRDVGDFRLIDRKVVEAFRAMPERDRFVRGMFAWLGLSPNRSGVSSAATAGRGNQIPAVDDGPSGGKRRAQLFRCPIAARDLVWIGCFRVRGLLRVLCGQSLVHEQPSR